MGRNFVIEAQNLISEFEKSRHEDFMDNGERVKKWQKENPKPTEKQLSKFDEDLWGRLYAGYAANEKRFGKSFIDYVLSEECKNSMPTKKDMSGPWRPLSKEQIKILKQREYSRLVSGVVRLLRSGKVKPLSS